MAAMPAEVRTNVDVARRIATLTVLSIVCSVCVSGIVTLMVFGFDLDATVSVAGVLRFGILMGIGVPAVVCPIVAVRSTMLSRDLNHARDALDRLARTDHLTGLLNRRGFEQAALRLQAEERVAGEPAAALMCDIDFFKKVNDQFGHEFGDAALRHVAEVLLAAAGTSAADPRDVVLVRYGGEEFVALLFGFTRVEAVALAEHVRETCARRPVVWNGNTARITMSVGIAVAANFDGRFRPLVALADAALYRAKRDGRNRVAISGDDQRLARAS
jgi:diguanylate cyclase (GGDEF)-like protein